VRVLNQDVVRQLGIPQQTIDAVSVREEFEIRRREELYRAGRPPHDMRGKTVILVDDGLATGATMRAAVLALREMKAARIVVAVPVGAPDTCFEFENEADEVICARTPEPFYAVGLWYEDFPQNTDDEIRDLMERSAHAQPAAR